jgi:Spondin_N
MINRFVVHAAASVVLAGGAAAVLADDVADASSEATYEVTVTNITRGQQFTPILVASHRAGVRLFRLGDRAGPELQIVAEEGDVAPLTAALMAQPGVLEVANSGALLDPGASATIRVRTHGDFDRVSVAAMLIPTNDAFFALNGVRGPTENLQTRAFDSVAYDAGSERNDERCATIPGPFFDECGGPGGGAAPNGGTEGYVHVHAGIHGIGDLKAARRDWRNPVARISIRRVP